MAIRYFSDANFFVIQFACKLLPFWFMFRVTHLNTHSHSSDEIDSEAPLSPPPTHFGVRNSMGNILTRPNTTDGRLYCREDFLHENAAMGGPNISMRRSKDRASLSGTLVLTQPPETQYHRMRILSADMDKVAVARRRRRSDKTDESSSSTRSSFGSGPPQHINIDVLRHLSTDESTTSPTTKTRSSSIDSNSSQVESPTRRLSSPFMLNNVGVLTASLKIPVQMQQAGNNNNNMYMQGSDTSSSGYLSSATTVIPNVGDDLDIPFIEDDATGARGDGEF
jgi:hypothetical protein